MRLTAASVATFTSGQSHWLLDYVRGRADVVTHYDKLVVLLKVRPARLTLGRDATH